jgi:3-dehydroquinate synthase
VSATERITVALEGRPYDILVGRDLIARAGEHVAPLAGKNRLVVVTDETVARLHLPALEQSLAAAGLNFRSVVVPPGEKTKDFSHFAGLAEDILAGGIDRGSLLVALGGGVVGDLTGFAAATLLRGIDFVQIPTTLLAQVDSSVGGKTGINTRAGKNLVGAFHQPRLVLADTGALATLPARELRAGYAEVVKYGLIRDRGFFLWLEEHGAAVLGGDPAAQAHAVAESCRAKARVVAADERESGERALLNFGHTFGHALEAETGFSETLLHGEAVAIGMALAFDYAASRGLCPRPDAARVRAHLDRLGLPASIRRFANSTTPEALLRHMAKDKKVRAGRLTFILPRAIGDAYVAHDVPPAEVSDFLAASLAGPAEAA